MGKQAIFAIILTLLSTALLSPCLQLNKSVVANPIPIPVLLMPREYINVTLSRADGTPLARVKGAYPFTNVGYQNVTMLYPVPPNSTSISVRMNDTLLDWTYDNQSYPTVIGDWPMIKWTVSPVPHSFVMNTYYEHSMPQTGEDFTFLYAMGTGRFLETYAKQTKAYVRVRMEMSYKDLCVYMIGTANGTWAWRPANYTIVQEGTTDVVALTVTSQLFEPMEEDLLLKFKYGLMWDINGDGKVDLKDVYAVGKAFGCSPGHPNWNLSCDINHDLKVDLKDYYAVTKNFGKTLP